jgi:hypothetical protein
VIIFTFSLNFSKIKILILKHHTCIFTKWNNMLENLCAVSLPSHLSKVCPPYTSDSSFIFFKIKLLFQVFYLLISYFCFCTMLQNQHYFQVSQAK